MDNNILKIFDDLIDNQLIMVTISNSTYKKEIDKVKIRPVLIKGEVLFQITEYMNDKVFHANHTKEALLLKLPNWFEGLFRQVEINSQKGQATILISKKGKATIKLKTLKKLSSDESKETVPSLLHNKTKNYILQEGISLPFLVDLGVMTKDGKVIKAKMDKFKQINRFLEFIEDIVPHLDTSREITILDFGCGKSYLTFALYYFLKEIKGYPINVIGLDLKTDVIEKCNALSTKYGYDKLKFLQGDIASYQDVTSVDMVVTLHACDTATDYALYKAVSWGAKVILSVPCCQHELNNQIKNQTLEPLLKYGIIKERISALITDALRAELLETHGYRVQLLEFIDLEHTPKNILIRAVKRDQSKTWDKAEDIRTSQLEECMEFLGVSPCLEHLFKKESEEEGK